MLSARINGESVFNVPDNTFGAGRTLVTVGDTPDRTVPSATPPPIRFTNLVVRQE